MGGFNICEMDTGGFKFKEDGIIEKVIVIVEAIGVSIAVRFEAFDSKIKEVDK